MKDITPIDKSSLLNDACNIIEQAQKMAYNVVNETLIKRNWLLGMRIHKEILNEQRAGYGEQVIKELSRELTRQYSDVFRQANPYHFVSFYNCFPNIFHAVSGKTSEDSNDNNFYAVSRNCICQQMSSCGQR